MSATLTLVQAQAAASPASARPASASSRRKWYTLAVLCLSLLITVVDSTIVNVALPSLARDLRAGTSGLQWITDSYTLAFGALLLLAGAIADLFGRHRSLAAGLTVFAVGSLAAALTRTTAELIAARAVMGTGAAFIMPATLSILTSVFTDPGERAKAIGIWSAISGLGVAIGPVVGGVLLAHFGWDSIFLVNLPLTAVALAAGHWLVPASRAPVARRLDVAGAIASVAAFTVLTWALIAAPGSGWLSAATLGRLAGAGVLLTAFAVIEARGDHPMLPLSLFRNRRLAGAAIALLALFFALSGAVFLTTQIYQVVLGYSPLAAGLRALPSAMTLAIAAAAGAQLAKRVGARVPVAGGLALVHGGPGLLRHGDGGLVLRALRHRDGSGVGRRRTGYVGGDDAHHGATSPRARRSRLRRQRRDEEHGQRPRRRRRRLGHRLGLHQPTGQPPGARRLGWPGRRGGAPRGRHRREHGARHCLGIHRRRRLRRPRRGGRHPGRRSGRHRHPPHARRARAGLASR